MILLGDNKACKILGSWSITIKMFNGGYRTLQNVRYVFDLKGNLISIGTLDVNWCIVKIDMKIMKFTKGAMIIMKYSMMNGLYILYGETSMESIANIITNDVNNTKLCHLRFDNICNRGLSELSKQRVFSGWNQQNLILWKLCAREELQIKVQQDNL